MPLYRLIWRDENRGYSVARSLPELVARVAEEEAFRGELVEVKEVNSFINPPTIP